MPAAFMELLAQAGEVHKSAAEEGRDIILSMLVVGLVFVAVAILGDLWSWRSHRRKHRT